MRVPCMVNNWLYCSFVTRSRPGWNNCARITSAMIPAIKKYENAVTKYM